MKACWLEDDRSKPKALSVMPRDILKTMNKMLSEMEFPSHYEAILRGSILGSKWAPPIGLKSHDGHKMT